MFSILNKFKHSSEMRESKDEILAGEIIRAMALKACPLIGFRANEGEQSLSFKPAQDPLLYSITINLDRKTGGSRLSQALVGSKAWLNVRAEVKNHVADPDDLLKMYRTDMKNIFKSPMLGDVRLDHQLSSVFATRQVGIDIDKQTPKNKEQAEELGQFLDGIIEELREKLTPYKK